MSEIIVNEIRKGVYLDSVALMRLSREIAALDGIAEAALMMGSPSNLEIMRSAGLLEAATEARPNDLVIALRAENQAAADAGRAAAIAGLDKPKVPGGAGGDAYAPRSTAAAIASLPGANLALISVPGDFAAAEARKALRRGLNVLMFSDNVPVADEVSLKREARDLGLLMMGPDCGTAIINGTPLAFANRVRRGGVGIIGASGTGTQEVSCLVSEAGSGISHAIGTGGRDLKSDVGGITALMAMDLLEADPQTDSVVLISKPPHPEVARKVVERVARSAKPYVLCFIGAEPMDLPANARQADTLREAAEMAANTRIGADYVIATAAKSAEGARRSGRIEGLFAGGTLAAEAQLVLSRGGRAVVSNAPVPGVKTPDDVGDIGADRVLDLGDDEYTRGRPHPMIDPGVRDDMLRAALADAAVSAILVDLVIGYGAHADPAGHLGEVLTSHKGPRPPVIASVTGTVEDPQGRDRQIATLKAAGITVAPSNAHACEVACAIVGAA